MILNVKDLRRSFTRGQNTTVEVLKGISFQAGKGEFISLMGPSGSGKSTLLQVVGGLDRPTAGEVVIGGTVIQKMGDKELSVFRRRRLGFIFQFFNLVPTLSVLENVAISALLDGKSMSSIRPRAMELLKLMGVDHRVKHRPYELSGGEMQRVAIARALLSEPELILADEPTGNLDTQTGETVLGLLSEMVKTRGHTLIMVTHDAHAASYGTRLLKIRDGKLESDEKIR